MKLLSPGRYRHYKNKDYQVVACARHSETEEWMVFYYPLYGDALDENKRAENYWVRPLAMFQETVLVDGREIPRFAKVDD